MIRLIIYWFMKLFRVKSELVYFITDGKYQYEYDYAKKMLEEEKRK